MCAIKYNPSTTSFFRSLFTCDLHVTNIMKGQIDTTLTGHETNRGTRPQGEEPNDETLFNGQNSVNNGKESNDDQTCVQHDG